jgi:hypothetical protein
MKGEIKMENTHSTFLVLRISEDKDNGRTEIDVVESFNLMVDAKKYIEAKDSIERLTPRFTWKHTQYKIQQVFYKSFVQEAKAS